MAARASRQPSRRAPDRKRGRISRPTHALRWIGLAILLVVAVGYVQPVRAYLDATADVEARKTEVVRMASANVRLEERIAETETPEFVEREARKLGLVKPGERLYIVTGIDEWKHDRQQGSKPRLR
jgi:cell division protein FtsB